MYKGQSMQYSLLQRSNPVVPCPHPVQRLDKTLWYRDLHMASVYASSIIIQRQQRGSDASCAFPTIYYHWKSLDCPHTQITKSPSECVRGTGYARSRYTCTCAKYYVWCNFKIKVFGVSCRCGCQMILIITTSPLITLKTDVRKLLQIAWLWWKQLTSSGMFSQVPRCARGST